MEKRFQACTAAAREDGASEWFDTFPEALRWVCDRVSATHPHYVEVWINYRTLHGELVEILESDTSWFSPDAPQEGRYLFRYQDEQSA